jgi:hypothetical protein
MTTVTSKIFAVTQLGFKGTCGLYHENSSLYSRRNIPEDGILHSHRCKNLKSYTLLSRLNSYIYDYWGSSMYTYRRNRSTTDQISAFVRFWRKVGECNETVHKRFIDFKKAYDSLRREVLYNNRIEFGILMKLVRLIEMCLN